jgi:uncharacterized membrane protein
VLEQGQFRGTDVPFAGASNTEALGINGQGDIVGRYFLSSMSGAQHGFLNNIGIFTSLDFPSAAITGASGINNKVQIVGDFSDTNFQQHGFILEGGFFHAIDEPSATNGTSAFGINDLGQIVGDYFTGDFGRGTHGFLLDAGSFSTIDVPFPGSFNTVVRGINNRSDLVGLYSDAQGEHGFVATLQTAVPETSSLALLGIGVFGLSFLCRRQRSFRG